jgi:CBS domain-containing protein
MPTIKDLLKQKNRKLITVSSSVSIFDALKIMAEANIGCLIVLESDRYVGMFTERDFRSNYDNLNYKLDSKKMIINKDSFIPKGRTR